LIGAAAFGLASVLAAFSTSAEMLIGARALLGIAGATVAPSTLSLIRNMFLDPGQRTFAIGIWVSSYSVGGAIGPLLGGVLLEFFWWGSVFLLAVPVMLLLLILGPILLPEYRDPEAGRLDLLSAAMSLLAVLAVIYGLKEIAQAGLSWLPIASILFGLAIGAAFVRRQRTLDDPLIDLRLFQAPAFSASLASYTLSGFIVFGALVFIAQYLQSVLGLSPLEAGLWTLPSSVGFIAGSMLTSRLTRAARPGTIMAGGFVLGAVGLLPLARVGVDTAPAVIAAASLIMSFGLSFIFTLASDVIVSSAPPERAGAAAAISETGVEFGGALGIAVLGSVFVAIYRRTMAGAELAGVPSDAATTARDTIGGAVATAQELPSTLGTELMATAREAFTQAMQWTSAISVVLALAAAVLVLVMLRDSEPEPEAEGEGARPKRGVPASGPAL
jgi:MFS transporter, DHA2 family, multidrug resistance protein